MRRRNFYLLSVLIVTVLFGACSKDKEEEWSRNYKKETLALKMNGKEITRGEVDCERKGDKLKLVLKGIVLGEDKEAVVFSDLPVNGDDFKGEVSNSIRKIKVEGNVRNEKLILDVSIVRISPLSGKWDVAEWEYADGEGRKSMLPYVWIKFEAKAEDGMIEIPNSGKSPAEALLESARTGLSIGFKTLVEYVKADFSESGNLKISYKEVEDNKANVLELEYFIRPENKLYLAMSEEFIQEMIQKLKNEDTKSNSTPTLPGLYQGEGYMALPVLYKEDAGNMVFYVTGEMVAPYLSIIEETVIPRLEDKEEKEDYIEKLKFVKGIFEQLKSVEFGLVFKK